MAFLGIFLLNYRTPLIITGGTIAITATILNDEKREKFFRGLFRRK